jgi:serine protease Do
MTVRIRVGELREDRLARLRSQDPPLGLTIDDLTPEVAKDLGVPEGKGVAVIGVTPGGPADAAGLRRGDVILEANRRPVKTREEFELVLRQRAEQGSLLILLRRGDTTRYIAMKGK